jgi:hypothetical protein
MWEKGAMLEAESTTVKRQRGSPRARSRDRVFAAAVMIADVDGLAALAMVPWPRSWV